MKIKYLLAAFVLLLSIVLVQGQSTAFTYQGRLNDGANPANGNYDFQFQVFDAPSGGLSYGSPNPNSFTALPVSNGLFTVVLDFGTGVFTGPDRWLQINARTNDSGAFGALSPREKFTAAPYAITAGNLTGTLPSGALSGSYGNAVTFNSELTASGGLRLNNTNLWLRGGSDSFHALGYYGGGKTFATLSPDGPVLFGWAGGILGSREGGEQAVLSWKSSGNVGIGTANPGDKLEVYGVDAAIRIRNQNDVGGGFIGDTWESVQVGIFNPSGSPFGVVAAGTKRSFFGFDKNGKVGSLTSLYGSPAFRNVLDDGNGNVGIGTTTPQTKLDVNGTVRATGVITALGGLIIENRTDDPAGPAAGRIWLRTDL